MHVKLGQWYALKLDVPIPYKPLIMRVLCLSLDEEFFAYFVYSSLCNYLISFNFVFRY